MIAAIQMQWLGVAVAALIVAVLLLVVLIRHRGRDDRVMAATDKMAGPVTGTAAVAEATPSWSPAAPTDLLASRAPQWAAPPTPAMAAPAAEAPAPPPPVAETPATPTPAAQPTGAAAPITEAPPVPVAEAPAMETPVAEVPVAVAPVAEAPHLPPMPPPVAAATALTPIVTPEQTGSFLDEPLTRGFEGLGKPSASEATPPVSHGPFPVDPFGSHEDIFPPEPQEPAASEPQEPAAEEPAPEEPAPEEPAAERPAADLLVAQQPAAERPAADVLVAQEPAAGALAGETPDRPRAKPAEERQPGAPEMQALTGEAPMAAAPAPLSETPTLLSEIIVTTGDGEVDLADPAVHGLLVQLVDDEIELAKACRDQEQTLDAILQLTEAEKICEALGLDDQLAQVKTLLGELQA